MRKNERVLLNKQVNHWWILQLENKTAIIPAFISRPCYLMARLHKNTTQHSTVPSRIIRTDRAEEIHFQHRNWADVSGFLVFFSQEQIKTGFGAFVNNHSQLFVNQIGANP